MRNLRNIFALILFLAIFATFSVMPIFSNGVGIDRMAVPDSAEIRKDIAELWFYKDVSVIRELPTEIHLNSVGQRFQVKLEETEKNFSVIVAPETTVTYEYYDGRTMTADDETSEKNVVTQSVSEYLGDACGSFELSRDLSTGKAEYVRFYITNDSGVYIQFSPSAKGNKTFADYVINGFYAARSVPIGINFETLYTASLPQIRNWTKKSLPWKYVDVSYGQYAQKLHMIEVIRNNLDRVTFQWDAAYDENEKPVRISDGGERTVSEELKIDSDSLVSATDLSALAEYDSEEGSFAEKSADKQMRSLSSAGFVKWIVDGLVKPLAGSGTYLEPLKRPTVLQNPVGYAGIRQEKDNLSFTLDWTRNLAAARVSVQTRKVYLYEKSGVDVTINPFSFVSTEKGITGIAGYTKDSGYRIDEIPSLLYVLGASEPTYFYLAAIRKPLPSVPGKSAEIYTFDEAAVIFPFFTKDNSFDCVIFQNGKELDLNEFISKNSDCYVHLTRVLSSDKFKLY
ncbi:hypothetical protein [Treponema zioleckii]|uniref:hypothetical protein n=1 Tax=Treponema zioleckii TaxID=331680 RepID=UPI00168BE231|nr:hypothetical protein [Treponema zioleckii]